jgi:hypothetical protein
MCAGYTVTVFQFPKKSPNISQIGTFVSQVIASIQEHLCGVNPEFARVFGFDWWFLVDGFWLMVGGSADARNRATVCRPPFTGYRPLSTVHCLRSAVCGLWSAVCGPLLC